MVGDSLESPPTFSVSSGSVRRRPKAYNARPTPTATAPRIARSAVSAPVNDSEPRPPPPEPDPPFPFEPEPAEPAFPATVSPVVPT
jgi:hypothetical protein